MGRDEKTDRFRPVFEPEDIFDRFVKNANASTEVVKPREDEPTGQIPADEVEAHTPPPDSEAAERRGGPPTWDHRITVMRPEPEPDDEASRDEAPVMKTVAEEERGTVRVRSPYGEDPSKSVELPDLEVDEDQETKVARSPLEAKKPEGLGPNVTEVQPSALTRALAAKASRSSASTPVSENAPTPVLEGPSTDGPVSEAPRADKEGTRPDAPMPLAMARAFDKEPEPIDAESDDATVPRGSPLLTDSGQRILLLTKKKPATIEVDLTAPPVDEPETPAVDHDILADLSSQTWKSVVAARGQHTQRLEAMKVVPDVEAAQRKKESPGAVEGGEDGQMPTRQLDQILSDMAVLLRYGHEKQVRERLDDLRRTYPEDLLLLRAIAEFFVEHELVDAACETLFVLAGGLFERRNVEGMRQALEQVLKLEPENERAFRLLGLLEQRSG